MCTGTEAGLPPKAVETSSGALRSYNNVVGSCVIDTDIRRLTTEIRSEKCVVRRFRRCANVYLHKPRWYSIAYYTPRLYGIAYRSQTTNLYSVLLY